MAQRTSQEVVDGVASHLGLFGSLCRPRCFGRFNRTSDRKVPVLQGRADLYATRPKTPARLIRATRSFLARKGRSNAWRFGAFKLLLDRRFTRTSRDLALPDPVTEVILRNRGVGERRLNSLPPRARDVNQGYSAWTKYGLHSPSRSRRRLRRPGAGIHCGAGHLSSSSSSSCCSAGR